MNTQKILLILMLCISVFALGCAEDTPETPEEQIRAELDKAAGVVQVESVTLNAETKALEISLDEPGYKDGAHFQELMGDATLGMMPKVTELSEAYGYEAVVITCMCSFIQAGEKIQDEGYQVILSLPDNTGTDWKGLRYPLDPIGTLKPHTLKLYVNPVFSR